MKWVGRRGGIAERWVPYATSDDLQAYINIQIVRNNASHWCRHNRVLSTGLQSTVGGECAICTRRRL